MREKAIDFKWIWILVSVATMLTAYFTLHDMQTSEGIGLYFAIRTGSGNRQLFDLLVDGAGMLCLFAAILFPCLLSGHLRPDSFLRLLSAYLAFLPTISMAALVHLADGTERIVFCGGAVGIWGMEGILPALAVGVPLLILTSAMDRKRGTAGEKHMPGDEVKPGSAGEKRMPEDEVKSKLAGAERMLQPKGKAGVGKRVPIAGKRLVGVICLLLLLIAALFPALADQCAFFFAYALLLYGFSLWERLWDEASGHECLRWILFGIFWLRGIYRMIEVMSVYHM